MKATHLEWQGAAPHASTFMRCLQEQRGYLLFIVAYGALAWGVLVWHDGAHRFAPLLYLANAVPLLAAAAILALGIRAAWSSAPLATVHASVKAGASPRGMALLVLCALLLVHLGIFTSVNRSLPAMSRFAHDVVLADLDAALHGADAWRLTALLVNPHAQAVLELVYDGVWGLVTAACLAACVFMQGNARLRRQYLWAYLIAWPVLGNLVAWALLSAGPALSSAIPAFPSLHVAQATLVVLLARRAAKRPLYQLSLVFWVLIFVGSVQLGGREAGDGYAALIATILIWKAVGRFIARADPRMA